MSIDQPSDRRTGTDSARPSDNGLLLKLELYSDPALLSAVRGALDRLTESLGFSPADCRSITRAVDEALTNIMRHCYCGRVDQPLEIHFSRVRGDASAASKSGLQILLCDYGPAVDPAKFKERSLDEVRPGGLGLHLIRRSMDEVGYERSGGRNQFRLVKYFESSKQSPGS